MNDEQQPDPETTTEAVEPSPVSPQGDGDSGSPEEPTGEDAA